MSVDTVRFDSVSIDPPNVGPVSVDHVSLDWDSVLDDLEMSILDGSEFVAPTENVPVEHEPRLRALLALCAERIGAVKAELASTGDELSRLAARGTSWGSGNESPAMTFNQSL